MTYNEKKTLYECVMKEISKVVRKRLMENEENRCVVLENECIEFANANGIEDVDLEQHLISVQINKYKYDESGRIIDDYDTYVNIVRAMIGEYDITFVTDDDEYITTDSINDEEECYELLKTLREELEN